MLTKVLPSAAVICVAYLWSVDGALRQNLHSISSLIIVSIEHLLGASIFWVSICGSY